MHIFARTIVVLVALSFIVSAALAIDALADAEKKSPSSSKTPSISTTKTRTASPSWSSTRTPSTSRSSSTTPSETASVSPSISVSPSMSPCPGAERNAILKQKVTKVYTNLVYPTSIQILAGQKNVYDLFANNTRGRVDPVGTFDNFKLLTEYFYALAANPQNRITSVDILDLFGEGNEVYVRVNVFFSAVNPNTTKSFNLTQSGRYFFNADDLIEKVDVTIHYLGKTSNPPVNRAAYTTQQNQNIMGICYTILVNPGTCLQVASLDPEGSYTNLTECITFMNQIPYGSWDDAEANSVVCRQLHTLLTAFDPVTHCPHVGKTGGGKCVDWAYSDFAIADY